MKLFTALFCAFATSLHAADFDLAARATNQLGIDLHRQLARGDENLCLSPYSIQSALPSAMRKPPPPPIPVKVDRPFLYAIQHVPSGACLFIGRMTDPR